MSLRAKVLVLIFVTFAAYGGLDYGIQRLLIMPSFISLEKEESIKDMGRAVQTIAREVEILGSSVADWALWDDTYLYTQDRNSNYRNANLSEASLVGLKINIMYIFDEDNKPIWGMVYDLENEQEVTIEGLERQLSGMEFRDDLSTVGGVLLTARGAVLVSAKPILTSESKGPARGYFVMGRFLSTESIAEQTKIRLQATPLIAGSISPGIVSLMEQIEQQEDPFIQQDKKVNRVYRIMPDIYHEPALLLEVQVPRSITARGQRAMSYALASLLGAGVIIMLMLIVVMQKIVLTPLQQLTGHTVDIGKTNDLGRRLSETRKDEIGTLSKEFNRMLVQLSAARKNLMDQSYHSGRAEVAVNVLHSVGNALNGVVLSSYQLMEKARQSKVGDVSKIAGLLHEPEGGLARFLTEDSRGQMVPYYLESLGTELEEERQFVLNEALALQDKVNQIKEIISRQQSFSKQTQVREAEQPEELLEDALKLSIDQRANTMIEIERDYKNVPRIIVDRHKVLQILLNLINSARSACMESERQDRKIVLRVFSSSSDRVVMQVVDNGVGISAESLGRIFEQGTTTATAGQDNGLHISSLAAYELGGKLTVQSEGPGLGATCTLELPLERNKQR